jgi:hypothetical protein
MSTNNDLPKKPTPEYQAASIKLHQDFSYYACQGVI